MGSKLVIIATYNEVENLPRLVDELLARFDDLDILVIDDNSPDGTGNWCEGRKQAEPRLEVIHRSGKLGLGSASIMGLQYGLEHDYEFIATMDSDFSHPPASLGELFDGLTNVQSQADVVIGSRYVAGGRVVGWPWYRRCMSYFINWYSRLFLRLPVRDCSGAYRCYRASILRSIDLLAIKSSGYAYLEEILWHLRHAGCRFRESPITYVDRCFGSTKINWREAFFAVVTILLLATRGRPSRGKPQAKHQSYTECTDNTDGGLTLKL